MNMIRTGILGGSFDPPTMAHALMAAELLNQKIVDKVVFVPCGTRQDKFLSDGLHRLKMVQLMIENVFPKTTNIEINDIEIKNGSIIPTYFMLKQLPYQNLYFVMGSDLVDTLHTWEESEALKAEFKFIILNRNTCALNQLDQKKLPKVYELMPEFQYGISSTEVRNRIKASSSEYLDCMGMVAKPVLEYIILYSLYQ